MSFYRVARGVYTVGRLGGFIGAGHLAGDFEVGAAAVAGSEYGARLAAGLSAAKGLGDYIRWRKSKNSAKEEKMDIRLNGRKRRRIDGAVVNDPASYKQLTAYKRRYGRKLRSRSYQSKLIKSVTECIRFRFANVGLASATQGKIGLLHQGIDATPTQVKVPLHLFNITAINQSGTATDAAAGTGTSANPPVGYELRVNSAGTMQFQAIAGLDRDGATAKAGMIITAPGDNLNAAVGRFGNLTWTRIRFCVWGKTQNPTQLRISLVKFVDPEYCPETYVNYANGNGSVISNNAQEFYSTRVKPLLNGLATSNPRPPEKVMKVLKRWSVNINPIDAAAETTAASDSRGHMKHLDLFNRWNRRIDFTEKLSGENVQTYAQLALPAYTNSASTSVTGNPRMIEKSIYLLIESVNPVFATSAAGQALLNSYHPSYDINIESCYSHVQKF